MQWLGGPLCPIQRGPLCLCGQVENKCGSRKIYFRICYYTNLEMQRQAFGNNISKTRLVSFECKKLYSFNNILKTLQKVGKNRF